MLPKQRIRTEARLAIFPHHRPGTHLKTWRVRFFADFVVRPRLLAHFDRAGEAPAGASREFITLTEVALYARD
jgi:hypothetical protein